MTGSGDRVSDGGADIRRRVLVTGRVQGVGFRRFVARAARTRDLAGWVRNRQDGVVELEVAGPAAAVDTFLAAVRAGPRGARVDDVRDVEASSQGRALEQPFSVRFDD